MRTYRQRWIGDRPGGCPTDMASFLAEIVGWQKGCHNAIRYVAAIEEAEQQGWLGERLHHYPDGSEPTAAYCLTESGYAQLEQIGGDVGRARKAHAFYEAHASRAIDRRRKPRSTKRASSATCS